MLCWDQRHLCLRDEILQIVMHECNFTSVSSEGDNNENDTLDIVEGSKNIIIHEAN